MSENWTHYAAPHPNEVACEGCIHGAGCRVIPCTDCGSHWHMLGLIDPPPFICNRCWDVRDGVTRG